MNFKYFIYFIISATISMGCNTLKKTARQKKVSSTNGQNTTAKADTTKKTNPKPYKEVITAKAVTNIGLFTIHKIDERYFFEIPDSLQERDILIVSRIAKAGADNRPYEVLGYAGDQIGQSVIRFSKGPNDKLFIKIMSFTERSSDSSENGMYRTVHNSNLQPISASFDIKAYTPDSSGSVVDVTDFLNSDNGLLYFNPIMKKMFTLGGLQKDKSYVIHIQSFPINVELQVLNTYSKEDGTATYELNTSFVLLPESPMKPRYRDDRIGYFARGYIDFDVPQGVDAAWMITRWRLVPKEKDKERYLKGELVEPEKPIIYYIDPATPKKWVPYLLQGVNDWQRAFEKAGFKNAIYALEAPKDDPEWSLYDARHNAIIYKPSVVPNASGPHVHDPRTGEILETHINWYHNVMQLLHDWYMVQAGPNDLKARKMLFDDSLMGQLIRFVSSHEVGHTLGLMHNFGSSSTIPVDSLRSKKYIKANGFCPSIMDYARFNYVAQPEDGFSEEELFPRIGVYDEWAIEWGYRWLPQLKTREEEKVYMNQWIISKLEKDKRLWYGPQNSALVVDPRCQAEDLGDNAMKAGYYGIQNLKRVMKGLMEWSKEPNENFKSLERMHQATIIQYQRYVMHVANNIGLYTWTPKTVEQKGTVVGFIPKDKQKEAVKFLNDQLFETPHWLNDKEIFSLIGGKGAFLPSDIQRDVINWIINFSNYIAMYFFQTEHPKEAYSFDELLTDLEKGIWKELSAQTPIDIYRRNLQKIYAERLIQYSIPRAPDQDPFSKIKLSNDYFSIFQVHMRNIVNDINKALPKYEDEKSRLHLIAIRNRLKQALDFNPFLLNPGPLNPGASSTGSNIVNGVEINKQQGASIQYGPNGEWKNWRRHLSCWDDEQCDEFLKY